jgi:hypothetical protein
MTKKQLAVGRSNASLRSAPFAHPCAAAVGQQESAVMPCVIPKGCLTRMVIDDHHSGDIAHRASVLNRIHGELDAVPEARRGYIASALLSVAVAQLNRRLQENAERRDQESGL